MSTATQSISCSSFEGFLMGKPRELKKDGEIVAYVAAFKHAPGNPAVEVRVTKSTFESLAAIADEVKSVTDGDGRQLPARRFKISGLVRLAKYMKPGANGQIYANWRAETKDDNPLAVSASRYAAIQLLPWPADLGARPAAAEAQQVLDLAEL